MLRHQRIGLTGALLAAVAIFFLGLLFTVNAQAQSEGALSITTVTLDAENYTLYSVPTGKRLIATRAILLDPNTNLPAGGSSNLLIKSLDGATYTLASIDLISTGLNGANNALQFPIAISYVKHVSAANATIYAVSDNTWDRPLFFGPVGEVKVILYGVLIDE